MIRDMQSKEIVDGMFQYKVLVFVGGDFNKFKELADITDDYRDKTNGCFVETSCGDNLLWLEDTKDITTIAHEALHITFAVCKLRDIRINSSSEELIATIQSWWVNELSKLKD